MLVSRFSIIGSCLIGSLVGGVCEGVYVTVLGFLLFSFLLLRFPYVYGMGGFSLFLFLVIFPLFLSLMFIRLDCSFSKFFSSFVPSGTPMWISPFVCLAETISYIVRPVVLIIRPFLNLSIGAMGGFSLGTLCIKYSYFVVVLLVLLFLYEIFVALVHWFIVCNILSFSKDH